jgi:choloylglycine hydrolase
LGNYLGMSAENPPAEVVGGLRLFPLGQGEGLRGVPADYTPTARFARLFSVLRLLEPAADASAAELLALHVCNAFDIPTGAVKEKAGGTLVAEVTVWDSVLNLSTPRYAYRMFGNPETYVVDLASVDFEKPERLQELRAEGSFTPLEV